MRFFHAASVITRHSTAQPTWQNSITEPISVYTPPGVFSLVLFTTHSTNLNKTIHHLIPIRVPVPHLASSIHLPDLVQSFLPQTQIDRIPRPQQLYELHIRNFLSAAHLQRTSCLNSKSSHFPQTAYTVQSWPCFFSSHPHLALQHSSLPRSFELHYIGDCTPLTTKSEG